MAELADIEMDFYESFFFSKELEPYPVQEEAFAAIFAEQSVLVTVPTGTGKTMMAKAAIFKALAQGRRVIYTTPLRALTEEKFRELAADFGDDKVGFATGDYQENPDAPIQVLVAEILWNKVYSDRGKAPADVVVMDEGHYFNDYSRGYVWEQTIIGLDPRVQLVILSATIGQAHHFCQWVERVRRVPMALVESRERKIPLQHEYREEYLIETIRDLNAKECLPAIIFVFGRERCFETARGLKSCRRFTSGEEKRHIEERCQEILSKGGVSKELQSLLTHGIGIHHAGILPRYKKLVEELAAERLLRVIVSTETIAAGINLPAKTVVFPSLRKFIRGKARLVAPAEFHQMAGRAGRPQFDDEGYAIALADEELVKELRKEIKDTQKRGRTVDEAKIRKGLYSRFRAEANKKGEVFIDAEAHQSLVKGEPAALSSRTRVTAEQILAIGLPDLEEVVLPGASDEDEVVDMGPEPAYLNLNIATVVDSLLLSEREKQQAHRTLAMVSDNLRALGVIDEHGVQTSGEFIADLQGIDGLFIWYLLRHHDLELSQMEELVEFLVDHDVIQKILDKKLWEKRKEWIRNRLRERRQDSPQVSWEDVEAEYDEKFPRELTQVELWHQEFTQAIPHPELHGGKKPKTVWATMKESELDFIAFVDTHRLAHEEGSLFSYLARCMKTARSLADATGVDSFATIEAEIRAILQPIEPKLK